MANENQSKRVYEQIEKDADFYQPAVYELLTFYHALDNQSEPLDGQFVPMTTVQSRSTKDVKIFAVGLIPPTSRVTGRILDRTSSVTRTLPADYTTVIQDNPDVGTSSTGDLPGQTGGIATSLPPPVGPTSTSSGDFYSQYVAMCNRLGVQAEELAKVIQSESGWRASAVAKTNDGTPIAKGLIQLISRTAAGLGMSAEEYSTFETKSRAEQLPWIEKFYYNRAKGKNANQLKAITFGGFNNPDGSIYNSTATAPGFKRPEFQREAYLQNRNLDVPPPPKGYITPEDLDKKLSKINISPSVLAGIAQAKADLGMAQFAPLIREDDPPANSDWVGVGSDNAQEASRAGSLSANLTLNRENLGKRFLEQQQYMVKLMQEALDTMARTPPLRLLVNPQSFRVQSAKHISDGTWGRNGPIIEHWGEEQDKIEGSGKIAAFYSMDAFDANGPGLTRTARQFSSSYQNLLSLWLIYKNNGGIWFPDPIAPSGGKVKNLSVVGSVYLYYDNILYTGSFDSFSITESETAPFTLEYSFSFTVRAWYLLDHLDDKQYMYGQSTTKSIATGSSNSPTFGGNNAQPSPNVALPPPASSNVPLARLLGAGNEEDL